VKNTPLKTGVNIDEKTPFVVIVLNVNIDIFVAYKLLFKHEEYKNND
jgi:hypothetical protein